MTEESREAEKQERGSAYVSIYVYTGSVFMRYVPCCTTYLLAIYVVIMLNAVFGILVILIAAALNT